MGAPTDNFPIPAFRQIAQRRVDGFGVAGRACETSLAIRPAPVDSPDVAPVFRPPIRQRDLRIKLAAGAGGGLEAGEEIGHFVASMTQCEIFAPLSVWVMDSSVTSEKSMKN